MPSDARPTIRLLRHATLQVSLRDTTLLVDPMLGAAGTDPPIQDSPNDRRNPLVELPDTVPEGGPDHDAVLVTHRHNDHFDDEARERLAADVPLVVHPLEAAEFREEGFTDVRPLDGEVTVGDLTLSPTPARHGHGDLAVAMAPVTGAILRPAERDGDSTGKRAENDTGENVTGDNDTGETDTGESGDEPTVYLTGDTVWYDEVATTLETVRPNAVIVNAGAAQFVEGAPITMDADDVRRVRETAPADALVAAVHMNAINHCLLSKSDLETAVDGVAIPADGETIRLE